MFNCIELRSRGAPGVVAHAFNPSTWEAEAGGFLCSRPAWSTEFQDSQGYAEKPCLEKPKKKKKCRGAGTSAPELAGSYLEVWPPGVCKQLTLFYLFLAVIRGS